MINKNRKTIFTAFILTGTAIIILSIAQSFMGTTAPSGVQEKRDTVYNIKSFSLPGEVTFAGERMPLDNFDTRESLEREILVSAYRHSSTLLIIMRANRYLPIIEKVLEKE